MSRKQRVKERARLVARELIRHQPTSELKYPIKCDTDYGVKYLDKDNYAKYSDNGWIQYEY